MAEDKQPKFTFELSGFPKDTFHVARFTGTEGLSRVYQFDVTLLSADASIDLDRALSASATFTIKRHAAPPIVWHGIPRDFQQMEKADRHVFYRAVLVPKLWWLTQTRHNQIFLDMACPDFIAQALADGGLSQGVDFSVNATQNYPKREYVCQYDETHFDFASRWMERNGLYFYFDQSGGSDKLVIADSQNVHSDNPGGGELLYSEPSGLDAAIAQKAAKSFRCEQRRLPKDVLVKDYNYRTPNLDIESKTQVAQQGQGTVYIYGDNILNTTEAKDYARIRSEELGCRKQVFYGESQAAFVQPGYTFELKKHYRDSFNQKYLCIEVKHEGSQEAWLTSGLGVTGAGLGEGLYYRNAFAAIPASTQFRAASRTPWPRIEGVLHAVIDAEGSGQYAELDSQGRYKVVMPFDLSGRKDGRASAWLRMAQPYAGDGHGMHFPLHKGTEVIVTHMEGNPDQPIIAGAVPNPATQSMVTSQNQTSSNIATSGGNRFHMEDQDGSQRILLHTPTSNTMFRLGAHNDPVDWSGWGTSTGAALYSTDMFQVQVQAYNVLILGESTQTVVGAYSCNALISQFTLVAGVNVTLTTGVHTEFSPGYVEMRASKRQAEAKKEAIVADYTSFIGDRQNLATKVNDIIADETRTLATHQSVVNAYDEVLATVARTYATQESVGEAREDIVEELNQTIAERNDQIAELEQAVVTLNTQVAEMSQTVDNLTDIALARTQSGDTHITLVQVFEMTSVEVTIV
jgi:type VI secretion system secreted protein VgrG